MPPIEGIARPPVVGLPPMGEMRNGWQMPPVVVIGRARERSMFNIGRQAGRALSGRFQREPQAEGMAMMTTPFGRGGWASWQYLARVLVWLHGSAAFLPPSRTRTRAYCCRNAKRVSRAIARARWDQYCYQCSAPAGGWATLIATLACPRETLGPTRPSRPFDRIAATRENQSSDTNIY